MEVRDLRALLTVVRCKSFTLAARELGYTQSAVSQQVAALEAELGQLLVHRRPTRATPAGERLAEHAAHVLLRLEVARSELAHIAAEPDACRLAASPLANSMILATALRDLCAKSPLVAVAVHTAAPSDCVSEVAEGLADIALVDGLTTPNEPLHLADAGLLSSLPLAESPIVVAMQLGHPLAGRASIDLGMLSDAPFVVEPVLAGDSGGLRPLVRRHTRSVVYSGSDLAAVTSLIAAGLGLALLPAHALSGPLRPDVSTVPLASPPLVHRTEVLSRRNTSTPHVRVIEALRRASGWA
ncbi:MAG TPA: LysR family transcriptional regulator [Acidimicrobiales bacterium]|nr:LysR family transcriptional regulator [Acidimicrobiales bacterium]